MNQLNQQIKALEFQKEEVKDAIKEIESSETAYKLLGGIMVKRNKDEIINELKDKLDLIDIQINRLKNMQKKGD